jgi:hypothetical protein
VGSGIIEELYFVRRVCRVGTPLGPELPAHSR